MQQLTIEHEKSTSIISQKTEQVEETVENMREGVGPSQLLVEFIVLKTAIRTIFKRTIFNQNIVILFSTSSDLTLRYSNTVHVRIIVSGEIHVNISLGLLQE